MDRFKQRRILARRVQVGARRDAYGARARRTKVAEDVAKQIARHDHIKKFRALNEVRGQDVDMEFIHQHIRESLCHLGYPLVPVGHGDGDAVGLCRAGQVALGTRARQLKSKAQYPVHPDARHHRLLHHDLALGSSKHAPANAGILALGILADDHHVDFAGVAPAAVATHHRRNDAGHESRWPQVHILVKVASK